MTIDIESLAKRAGVEAVTAEFPRAGLNPLRVPCYLPSDVAAMLAQYRREVLDWQPIETAPRGSGENGPRFVTDPGYVEPPKLLLYSPEGMVVGYYDWYYHEGYGAGAKPGVPAWRTTDGGPVYDPTHWMPLPEPPAALRRLAEKG